MSGIPTNQILVIAAVGAISEAVFEKMVEQKLGVFHPLANVAAPAATFVVLAGTMYVMRMANI